MREGDDEARSKGSIHLSLGDWLGVVAISLVAAFPSLPGRMNPDAVAWFEVFADGSGWGDWHIPLLLWSWRLVGMTPTKLAVETVLVAILMVAAFAWLIRAAGLAGWRAFAATALAAFYPPIYSYLVAVSRDTWLAAVFLGIFVLWAKPQHRSFLYVRAGLVALATIVRPETLLLIPVFAIAEYLLAKRRWRPAVHLLAVAVLLIVAHNQFVYRGLGTARTHPESVIFIFDLAGISVKTGELLLPAAAFPAADIEVLEKNFNPRLFGTIAWLPPVEERVVLVRGDDLKDLRAAWIAGILAHPKAYLETRLALISGFLQGGAGRVEPGITPANDRVQLFFPEANALVTEALRGLPFAIFNHWLPLFGSVALFFLLGWLGDPQQVADRAMLAVGFAYQMTLLLVIVAAHFRFGYVAGIIFYVVLLRTIIRQREALVGFIQRVVATVRRRIGDEAQTRPES